MVAVGPVGEKIASAAVGVSVRSRRVVPKFLSARWGFRSPISPAARAAIEHPLTRDARRATCQMAWRNSVEIPDRIFATLPYFVPLAFATAIFGAPALKVIPGLSGLLSPILIPVLAVYRLDPTGGLLIFFAAFLLVVRNPRIKHFIRYNTLQAILIELLVTLIVYLNNFLLAPIALGAAARLLGNFVFLAVLVACTFAIIQCARGLYAELPVVSNAVRGQIL